MDSSPPKKPTLFFCLGATKAGTTWLYSQLNAHPDCYLRSIKELHYFSMVRPKQFVRAADKAREEAEQIKARTKAKPNSENTLRRLRDIDEWCDVLHAGMGAHDKYLAYLQDGIGSRHLIGDLTPAYGLLDDTTLTMMAQLTPDVRFIYLMRDPVARLWSNVRMNASRVDREQAAGASVALMQEVLAGVERKDIAGMLKRGDYCKNLDTIERAIPAAQRLVMFYEDMVAPGGFQPICDFLGISAMVPATEQRVHEGVYVPLPPELRAEAREFLKDQYTGVEQRMGAVPLAWAAKP